VDRFRLRDDDLVWREVEDEVIILDMRASVYASVNEAGRALWLKLAEGASLDDLTSELVRRYELNEADATRDAKAFLQSLRDQDLLS
jgi:hypothetical protein